MCGLGALAIGSTTVAIAEHLVEAPRPFELLMWGLTAGLVAKSAFDIKELTAIGDTFINGKASSKE